MGIACRQAGINFLGLSRPEIVDVSICNSREGLFIHLVMGFIEENLRGNIGEADRRNSEIFGEVWRSFGELFPKYSSWIFSLLPRRKYIGI